MKLVECLGNEKNVLDFVERETCNLNISLTLKIIGRKIEHLAQQTVSIERFLVVWMLITISPAIWAQQSNELLTNAVDVISLPAEKASDSIKVLVTGVVTASDPALMGRFFVQDGTGGVFVDNANGRRPEPGEVVQVSGITYIGAYAPTITAPQVRKIGVAPLPPAKSVSVEELMSGAEDSQRIEISGIVRDTRMDGSRLAIDLVAGGFRFRAYVIVPADFQPQKLIGAQVLIRGTAAEAHNRSLRQLITVEIYIPAITDLIIEKAEPVNPFDKAIIPLNKLAQFRRDNSLAQRVHVRGVVTLQKPGEYVFLQDASGGLEVQNHQAGIFHLGEVVEAVGFPSFENHLPVLQDAAFKKTSAAPVPVTPKTVTIQELQNGLHHGEFVSLTGKLIERTVKQGSRVKTTGSDTTTVLVLQGTNFTFTAEADNMPGESALGMIPVGSVMEVNGICLTEIDDEGKLKSFQILMRSPEDFRIIKKPSWFTPQRLLAGFLIVSCVLFVIVSWTVMLSRKNQVLNFLIRERENAQRELQQAHDQLEERVKERTAELKFQITARKESEVQFKAVLAERTRLAQELHDTVEQTLTGLAWQLDAAFKLYSQNPASMLTHLELARKLMSRSQTEVRQSVWDLRRLVHEKFDLAKALVENARQIASSAGIRVDLKTKGQARALPEIIEEGFLRINHEALINVIKHSDATSVSILLEFEPQRVILTINDNGRGFLSQNAAGPNEGHFGLLGISERVKRLGGRFNLASVPNHGTTLQIEIPFVLDRENSSPILAGF
jgi:signal transduction histidine kinase